MEFSLSFIAAAFFTFATCSLSIRIWSEVRSVRKMNFQWFQSSIYRNYFALFFAAAFYPLSRQILEEFISIRTEIDFFLLIYFAFAKPIRFTNSSAYEEELSFVLLFVLIFHLSAHSHFPQVKLFRGFPLREKSCRGDFK